MKQIILSIGIAGLFTMSACSNSNLKENEAAVQIRQHTIDSMNRELARQHIIDSMNEYTRFRFTTNQPVVAAVPVAAQAPKVVYVQTHRNRSYAAPSHGYSNSSYVAAPVYKERKRGWSAKATGAVIGAGAGGLTGALVNGRNHPAGAAIGTLLGAGAGLGIGAIIDKKNGR